MKSRLLAAFIAVAALAGCHERNDRSAAPGIFNQTLSVTQDSINGIVILNGAFDTNGQAAPATGGRAFGSVTVGNSSAPLTIVVSNPGDGTLSLGSPTFISGNSADFTINTTGFQTVLEPGQQTSFTVSFSPANTGQRTAIVGFTHDVGSTFSPYLFPVSGNGVGGSA